MTLQNITVNTPNNTNTFFVKADTSSSEWVEQSSSADWNDRRGHCCYEKDGTLFISGGQNASESFSDIWKSTDNGETWTLITNTASFGARYNHFVLELSGTLFLFGGSDITECSDVWSSEDGEIWTLVTASWNISGLRSFGACVHNGKLCIAGGYKAPDYSDSFWTSEDGAVWTEVSSNIGLPLNAFNVSTPLFSFNGVLYVLSHGEIHKSIDNGVTWSTTADSGVSLSPILAKAVTNENGIYVSGGFDAEITTQLSDKLWTSEDGSVWTQQTLPCGKRYAHGVFLNSTGFIICGGASNNSPMVYENDVWALLHHYIQCPVAEAEGVAVLRYIPTETGTYQGEVFNNASALKQYTKFPVSLTVLNVLTVDVFVSITDPEDDPDYAGWFQVGKGLSVVGTSFGLLESDVPVGTNIWVMVRDSVNAGVYDIHTAHVYSTITLDTYPDHAEIDEVFTVSGKANCSQVKITFTSTSGEVSYVVSVVNGAYSKADCAMSTVDGFVPFDNVSIKVEDNNDALSFVTVVDALVVVPTMEFDTPIELVAGVQKTVTGTSNHVGQKVELESRLSGQVPEDEWTQEGQATVGALGTWSIDVTIAVASTRDFRLIDETLDPAECSAQVDDVEVASGSLKIQLDSVNCDFYTVDSCAVGTDKIAILGYATITDRTALASIEGVTICGANVCTTNGNTVGVSVLYNLSTESVVWIKSHLWNVGNEHIASEYDTPNAKAIVTDGTNVFYPYSLYYKVGATNSIFKFYLAKVAVSDGTLTSSAEILSANQAGTLAPAQVYTKVSLTMLGDYIYMMYNPNPLSNASTSSAIGLRITKSDLTLGSATNLTGIMTYSEHNFCDNDGTYIYWMSWNSTTGYSYVMRTNADMSGLTTATTITISGASYPRGFVINGSQRIYSVSEGANSRTSDGTNSYATLGKPSMAGTYLHLKPGITHTEKTIKQLSTVDLTETWSKDYTADAITGVNKIEKVGDYYYVTGHSSGDFDGDHAANTKSCLIIGKINIANGDL